MAKAKCGHPLHQFGIKCSLEKGHLVQEALPEELESKHSHSGYVEEDGEKIFFHVEWD